MEYFLFLAMVMVVEFFIAISSLYGLGLFVLLLSVFPAIAIGRDEGLFFVFVLVAATEIVALVGLWLGDPDSLDNPKKTLRDAMLLSFCAGITVAIMWLLENIQDLSATFVWERAALFAFVFFLAAVVSHHQHFRRAFARVLNH